MRALYAFRMDGYAQRLGFDVLTAPLAELDRRSLSQAWYSALHLARTPSSAPPAQRVAQHASTSGVHERGSVAEREGETSAVRLAANERPCGSGGVAEISVERRRPRSPLAKKIERAFTRPQIERRASSFALDGSKTRVHVMIRTSGSDVRIVALCAPQERERVMQALTEARFALAKRAIVAQTNVREQTR